MRTVKWSRADGLAFARGWREGMAGRPAPNGGVAGLGWQRGRTAGDEMAGMDNTLNGAAA